MKKVIVPIVGIVLLSSCGLNNSTSKLSFDELKDILDDLPSEANLLKAFDLDQEKEDEPNRSNKNRSISVSYETDSKVKYDCYSAITDLSDEVSAFLFEYKEIVMSAINSVSSFGSYEDFTLISYADRVEYVTKNKYTQETGKYYMYNRNGEIVPVARCLSSTVIFTIKENYISVLAKPDDLVILDNSILQYKGKNKVDSNIFSVYCSISGDKDNYSSLQYCGGTLYSYTNITVTRLDDEVRYVENEIGLGIEEDRNYLTINRFSKGVVTSNMYYAFNEDVVITDSPLKELSNQKNRILFTTQINDGTNAGLCLFPFSNAYSISGTMVRGWENMEFADDYYTNQDYSLGFLGKVPVTIKTTSKEYTLRDFVYDTNLYPATSLFYYDENDQVMPERISFCSIDKNLDSDTIYEAFQSRLEGADLEIIDSKSTSFNNLIREYNATDLSITYNKDLTSDRKVIDSWLNETFYSLYNTIKISNYH